jgi:hypothetical protein
MTSLSLLDIYPQYSRKWDKLKNFSYDPVLDVMERHTNTHWNTHFRL